MQKFIIQKIFIVFLMYNAQKVLCIKCYQSEMPASQNVSGDPQECPPEAHSCLLAIDMETGNATRMCQNVPCQNRDFPFCRVYPWTITTNNNSLKYCCCDEDGCNTSSYEIRQNSIERIDIASQTSDRNLWCYQDNLPIGLDHEVPRQCPWYNRACLLLIFQGDNDAKVRKIHRGCARNCNGTAKCEKFAENLPFTKLYLPTMCCCMGNGCNRGIGNFANLF